MLDEHRGRGEALLAELTPERIEALARVELELELIAGDPAEAISRVAETHAAGEIAVGSRGLGRGHTRAGG